MESSAAVRSEPALSGPDREPAKIQGSEGEGREPVQKYKGQALTVQTSPGLPVQRHEPGAGDPASWVGGTGCRGVHTFYSVPFHTG